VTASREEKLDYLNEYLRCFSSTELIAAHNLTTNMKNKRKKGPLQLPSKKWRQGRETVAATEDPAREATASASVVSVDVAVSPTREPMEAWYQKYLPDGVVALDCEMVIPTGSKRMVAGSVSMVNFAETLMYNKLVKHLPGTFETWKPLVQKTGFHSNSLTNGTDLEIVKREVQNILAGKLVIICGGGFNDLTCLGLDPEDYNIFDLHKHFYTLGHSLNGRPDPKPISLRRLVLKYYKIDIQSGVHNSATDASYTMKLFKNEYMATKTENIDSMFNPYHDIFNFFVHEPKPK
jgi:hypothetical protein